MGISESQVYDLQNERVTNHRKKKNQLFLKDRGGL